jgi:predicted kinase
VALQVIPNPSRAEDKASTGKYFLLIQKNPNLGAGKSTLSKTVVSEFPSFIRLSIDAYIWAKYGAYEKDYPASKLPAYQDEAEAALDTRLGEILASGHNDVVLDLSCAFREDRDEYRRVIEEGGARAVLVYLQCDKETLWRRIQARARGPKDADSSFKMTMERLDMYLRDFEPPVDEGQIVIDRSQEADIAEELAADP